MTAKELVVKDVKKEFVTRRGKPVQALAPVNLTVQPNSFVSIVGPSGCGKSTLLRMIAGIESCESGKIFYGDEPITRPNKNIGMVFQEYSLLPWRTVADNVSLGPEFAGKTRKERSAIASEYLSLVNLAEFANSFPHELSGGMRQRVAIARALANKPRLLLMDEPFGALDAHTRILLQKELLNIWQTHRTTILFVTHSVDEAVYLSDKIVVMSARPGSIKQTIDVGMSYPRSRRDPEFAALTQDILEML